MSSTRTLVTLLRPWIRRFTILSLLGGFEQAANLRRKKSKRQQESLENGQLLSGCGFVQNIAHRRFLVIGG